MSNEYLLKFIDSVISGDEDIQKQSFAAYTQYKSKEILANNQKINDNAPVQEAVTDGITLEGNSVYANGKRVGYFKTEPSDDSKDASQRYFVDLHGNEINISNNDMESLMQMLSDKFLGNKK